MGDTPEEQFEPNQEFLTTLLSMGVSKEVSIEALFCTGNDSVDAAINYIFTNDVPEASGVEYDSENTKKVGTDKEFGTEAENNEVCEPEEDYKMTFVINTNLKMGIGKMGAQVAHACLGIYRKMLKQGTMVDILKTWEYLGEKKVVLKGIDESHLQELHEKAAIANIPVYLVRDAGRTEIAPNSLTVLSLFGSERDIDKITGKLSLL